MFANVKADAHRYARNLSSLSFTQRGRLLFESYGFHAALVYRFGKWSERQFALLRYPLLAVYYALGHLVTLLYGIHIKRAATIEPGLYIGHFGAILIGDCNIGANSTVGERVTIDSDQRGAPIVGKSVWVGANAKIIGPVCIGDGATIGAGAVITKDIPPRCLAMGAPARVVFVDYDNSSILGVNRQ